MRLNGIKHIFFDLDHTLWDFDKNSALTLEKIFDIHDVKIDISDFLKVYEPINFDYWKLYRDEKISKEYLRYKRLKDSFDALNFKVSDAVIHKLSFDYIEYLTTYNYLIKGAIELLDYLENDYHLHIITNGFKEAQQRKLDNANISKYFKTITNSESAGVKKPNPIIFNHALESARAIPSTSVMIGDNYEADIQGALDVGMKVILFNYHNYDAVPNIKQVRELVHIKSYL